MPAWDFFEYEENDASIRISKYSGPGGVVEIPSEIHGKPVTEIGPDAFDFCRNIKLLKVPDSVKKIDENCYFYQCNLERIHIGASCENLSGYSWQVTYDLNHIEVARKNMFFTSKNGVLFSNDMKVLVRYPPHREDESYTVPDTVEHIGEYAFGECIYLKRLNIGKNTIAIGYGALSECISLSDIAFGQALVKIEEYAFSDCCELRKVHIPDGVTRIESRVFINCARLETVDMPEHVEYIGESAFGNCIRLRNINIPKSLIRVHRDAFESYHEELLPDHLRWGRDIMDPSGWEYFGRNADRDWGTLSVYTHTLDGYVRFKSMQDWFDILVADIDEYYRLCEENHLIFVWANK